MTDPTSAGPTEAGRRLLRSSAVVGVGTGGSRVTGLLRVLALVYALGGFVVADAYNLANTTPNIIYELLLGGVLSATLVPVFVERPSTTTTSRSTRSSPSSRWRWSASRSSPPLFAPLIIRIYTIGKDPAAPTADLGSRCHCSSCSPRRCSSTG